MATLFIRDLTDEEKRRLNIAKAKSGKNWKEFIKELVEMYERKSD